VVLDATAAAWHCYEAIIAATAYRWGRLQAHHHAIAATT
jgi:hypothetical protein